MAALLLGLAALAHVELDESRVMGMVRTVIPEENEAPDLLQELGSRAPVDLPGGIDFATFFDPDPELLETDPERWSAIFSVTRETTHPEGWASLCREVNREIGEDRSADVLLGALACSEHPPVTRTQQFAAYILQTQAYVALYKNEVPGFSRAGIEGRQGTLAVECTASPIFSDRSEDSPFGEVCGLVQDTSYRQGDKLATFRALGAAYELVAEHIAARDPAVAPEAAFFDTGE